MLIISNSEEANEKRPLKLLGRWDDELVAKVEAAPQNEMNQPEDDRQPYKRLWTVYGWENISQREEREAEERRNTLRERKNSEKGKK